MNGTEHELAGLEILAQTVAAGVRGLLSVERSLVLPEATQAGEQTKNVEMSDMAIHAKAFHCGRAARRDERNGFPNTAAMEWRNAAELFAPNTRAVEYCWREWERIMHLPRRLAGPVSVSQHR